jgi:hypothetical protein
MGSALAQLRFAIQGDACSGCGVESAPPRKVTFSEFVALFPGVTTEQARLLCNQPIHAGFTANRSVSRRNHGAVR